MSASRCIACLTLSACKQQARRAKAWFATFRSSKERLAERLEALPELNDTSGQDTSPAGSPEKFEVLDGCLCCASQQLEALETDEACKCGLQRVALIRSQGQRRIVVASFQKMELVVRPSDCSPSQVPAAKPLVAVMHVASGDCSSSGLDIPEEWEIRPEELKVGPRIGIGSYGEVHRGVWRYTDVAVKRLIDQDLSPQLMEVRLQPTLRCKRPVLWTQSGAREQYGNAPEASRPADAGILARDSGHGETSLPGI